MSEKVSDDVRWLMREVVVNGTGRKADTAFYPVGGKTGTAEKARGRGGYDKNEKLASFIASFPIHDPKYVLLVMVDEPKGRKDTYGYATGGWVAAPAVKAIIERSGPALGPGADWSRTPSAPDGDLVHQEAPEGKAMSAAAEIIAGASSMNARQYSGLTADSRKVVRGGLFAALKGVEADGRSYADQAVLAGAAAILTDMRPLDHAWGDNVHVIQHQDPRATLATMAAAYYGVQA